MSWMKGNVLLKYFLSWSVKLMQFDRSSEIKPVLNQHLIYFYDTYTAPAEASMFV